MAQDRYGQGYGQRRWPEGGREDFRVGEEGRAFGPQRSFRSAEERDAWGADARRGAFGRDDYRDRERGGFADDRGEGRRAFDRWPGRFDQDYPGPDISGAWADRMGDERRFGAGEHRGHGPKGYRRSDERIREDVCDRLTDDPHLDARNIEVQVKNCEVILDGSVDSRQDKRRAEMIADMCSGVENVQNNLRAQPSQGESLRQHA